MTVESAIRSLNLQAIPDRHTRGRRGARRVGGAYFNDEQLDSVFESELARVSRFHAQNLEAYQNRRRQLRQNDTQLRIISRVGYDQLLRADLVAPHIGRALGLARLEGREGGTPLFKFIAPKTNASISRRQRPITLCVMHGFGQTWDLNRFEELGTRVVAIDPRTGHNPGRYINGVHTFSNTARGGRGVGIHHIVSLRGDCVNSAGWDNIANHARRDIKRRSIGIEHEMWHVLREGRRLTLPDDQAPFSEEMYAIDAFILKKLEAFTGSDFKTFLGHRETAAQNVRNNVIGCVNHIDFSSSHLDPGSEYFLTEDYQLHVSDLRTHASPKYSVAKWQAWINRWWRDVPRGTQISAYARIFDKMRRLRSFNLQSEVFDPALGRGPIEVTVPPVSGTYTVAAVQGVARDRLNAVERAQQIQGQARAGLYSAAGDAASASITAWAERTANQTHLRRQALRLPVIVNALGFDYGSGTWVNTTTINSPNSAQAAALLRRNANPPADTPSDEPVPGDD